MFGKISTAVKDTKVMLAANGALTLKQGSRMRYLSGYTPLELWRKFAPRV